MKSFLKLLQPSSIEFVIALIFTMAILVITNSSTILLGLVGSSDNETAQTLVTQYSHQITFHGGEALLGRLVNLLVWGAIGAVFYIAAWMTINAFMAVRNDVVIGTFFMRPANSRSQYWFDTLGRFFFRLGAAIVLLFIFIWTILVWLPTSIQLFHRWVAYIGILPYVRSALLAIIGWLLLMHLMVVMLRLVFLRVRLIGADEAK